MIVLTTKGNNREIGKEGKRESAFKVVIASNTKGNRESAKAQKPPKKLHVLLRELHHWISCFLYGVDFPHLNLMTSLSTPLALLNLHPSSIDSTCLTQPHAFSIDTPCVTQKWFFYWRHSSYSTCHAFLIDSMPFLLHRVTSLNPVSESRRLTKCASSHRGLDIGRSSNI